MYQASTCCDNYTVVYVSYYSASDAGFCKVGLMIIITVSNFRVECNPWTLQDITPSMRRTHFARQELMSNMNLMSMAPFFRFVNLSHGI